MKSLTQRKPTTTGTSNHTSGIPSRRPIADSKSATLKSANARISVTPIGSNTAKPSGVTFAVGDDVHVIGTEFTGTAKYVGPVHFSTGTWIGLELSTPTGRNDGSVQGKRFFSCEPNCGLFIKCVGCEKVNTSPESAESSSSTGVEAERETAPASSFGGLRPNSVTAKLLKIKEEAAKQRVASAERKREALAVTAPAPESAPTTAPTTAPAAVRKPTVGSIVRRGNTADVESMRRQEEGRAAEAQAQAQQAAAAAVEALTARVAAMDARMLRMEDVVIKMASSIVSAEENIARLHSVSTGMGGALAKCSSLADGERKQLEEQVSAKCAEIEALKESFASVSALAVEAQQLLRVGADEQSAAPQSPRPGEPAAESVVEDPTF